MDHTHSGAINVGGWPSTYAGQCQSPSNRLLGWQREESNGIGGGRRRQGRSFLTEQFNSNLRRMEAGRVEKG